MYGFGDVKDPQPESVELMASMAQEYICEISRLCARISGPTIKDTEILFVVRRNRKQYNRGRQLKAKNAIIKKAKDLANLEPNKADLLSMEGM